jgi:arabinose-5-phosphate isomerase
MTDSSRQTDPYNVLDVAHLVIGAEIEALSRIRLDSNFERAVGCISKCAGKLITTGIGKAGHIARKSAATFSSTGTPSIFLHPSEAGHGDLGLLAAQDCMLAYSTSGKTREVLETLEYAKHLHPDTVCIGITSHPDSALRRLCQIVIDMGIITEPCPMGLTPTASCAVMLAISDALAMCLLHGRGARFTSVDFGLRHHAGYLGDKSRGQ